MNLFHLRVGNSPKYYPSRILIFGLGHYISVETKNDDFSQKLIYFYKYGNNLNLLLDLLKEMYALRFKDDFIKFDYMTLYPTRNKNTLNPYMDELLMKLSKELNLPSKKILQRNKDIKPNHELKTFEERVSNLKESIEVLEDVTGKNIIIFDNVSTTGISLIYAGNILLEKGAKEVVGICLGLSNKEAIHDWSDLNKTFKYQRIKELCKSPFIPKELRKK